MMPTTEKGREVKIGGRRRTDPGEPLHLGEARVGRGTTGAVSVVNETGVVGRGEEVIDEVIVLRRDALHDMMLIGPDVMVDSKKDTTTSRGTIRGRPLVDSARSSGPHWPRGETGPTVVLALLPRRTEWPTEIRRLERRPPTDQGARELI